MSRDDDGALAEMIEKHTASEASVLAAQTTFHNRLARIVEDITLAEHFAVTIARDQEVPGGRFYFQIICWRKDAITGEMGWGYGGKAYLSPHASDSELVQTIFGLYRAYFEHEARETFSWKGRRVFGPHISTQALWEVARRVDIRSAKHVDDRDNLGDFEGYRSDPHYDNGGSPQ